MKYLLVAVVIFLVAWRWRSSRDEDLQLRRKRHNQSPNRTTEIEACAHCGVHGPAIDMQAGQRGNYCSAEHRRQAEG
ncbi:MAG: PP0621 family protein [Rhodoferax sp.]|nr:PP0621 family protein [Rhodoferax sp.]